MMYYQKIERKQTGSRESHHGIGYQKRDTSTEGFILGHIYVVSILIPFRICYRKFMKGYAEAIREEDLWRTVP